MTLKQSLALAAGWLACHAAGALAQAYPNKSIRVLVPYAAGGFSDISSRVLTERIGKFPGTTSRQRDPRFPNAPTLGEGGLAVFDLTYWVGIFGPPGLHATIQARLNSAVNTALTDESLRLRMAELRITPAGGSPDTLPRQIKSEFDVLRKIASDAKLKFD